MRTGHCFLPSLYGPSQLSLVEGRAPVRGQGTRWARRTRLLGKLAPAQVPFTFAGDNRGGAASEPEQFLGCNSVSGYFYHVWMGDD